MTNHMLDRLRSPARPWWDAASRRPTRSWPGLFSADATATRGEAR